MAILTVAFETRKFNVAIKKALYLFLSSANWILFILSILISVRSILTSSLLAPRPIILIK